MNFLSIISKIRNSLTKEDDRLRLNVGKQISLMEFHTFAKLYWNGRGTVVDSHPGFRWKKKVRELFVVPEAEPNPHMLIVGMSGYGKSSLLRSMIKDIGSSKVPAIVFDAHNEHESTVMSCGGSVYDAKNSGISLFELNGLSIAERTAELVMLLKELYGLGHIQATKLSDCIWYTYRKKGAASRTDRFIGKVPMISDLLSELEIFIRNARYMSERNSLLHLKERLSILNTHSFNGNFVDFSSLGSGITSFSLAGLKNRDLQIIYINELLRRLYVNMKENKKERGLQCYIVIDEAQFLLEGEMNSVVRKIFEEGRKYGVGAIIATHAASSLSRKITANAAVFVTFYSREPSEVSYVSALLSGGRSSMKEFVCGAIGSLDKNQALVLTSATGKLSLVSTPRIETAGPTNVEELEFDIDEMDSRILNAARKPFTIDDLRVAFGNKNSESVAYRIDALVYSGRLERFDAPDGKPWVMRRKATLSAEHEVMVTMIAEYLNASGIINWPNKNPRGPDIVAYYSGYKIAVEYETGRKKVEETAAMINKRRNYYDFTLVIVNDAFYGAFSALSDPCVAIVGWHNLK